MEKTKELTEEELKNKSYWNKSEIHTVYVIKNGNFDIVDISELDKKNYYYRLYSRVEWVAIINYDMNDMIPITKDILNRQNTFIEIKLLKWMMIIAGVSLLLSVIIAVFVYWIKPSTFDIPKNEILQAIQKMDEKQNRIPIPTPKEEIFVPDISTSTTTTRDTGILPVYPENSLPNRKRNTPNYGN